MAKKGFLIGGVLFAIAVVIIAVIPEAPSQPQDRLSKEQRQLCAQVTATADADDYAALCDPDSAEGKEISRAMKEVERRGR